SAAGFGDEQGSRRHVPRIQSEFPECVQTPAGDIGEIDGRRSTASDAVCGHRHLVIKVDVHVEMALAAGKAGRDQSILQAPDHRHTNATMVEISSCAALGGKHLLAYRVKYDADQHFTILLQAQRNVEDRVAMRKIGCAVERVDVPTE